MANGHSNLFVFHQAIAQQGRLWCGVTENHVWEPDALVPSTGMTGSPSAVEFNGEVYCFHQGFAANGTLYFNIYDGILWEGDRQVPATGMSEGPSVVEFEGRLYCFHQGAGEDGGEARGIGHGEGKPAALGRLDAHARAWHRARISFP